MKNKIVRRLAATFSAAVLAVGTACMFAGCTSKHPVVTITYNFNGSDYAVEYELSRTSAPQTVQHFIELADAGYYDGTCIHSYDSNYLFGGGYTIEDGELKEKDYFAEMDKLVKAGTTFTQSVTKADDARTPLYTVYGEFSDNGSQAETVDYRHSRGALVMYYPEKSANGIDVLVRRNDGGKGNDGEEYQKLNYAMNSATSLFYTYLGGSNSARDQEYCVFGKVTSGSMSVFEDLLSAIGDYESTFTDETEEETASKFTVDTTLRVNSLDHVGDPDFENVRKGNETETFHAPLEQPILITSVKVTKY